MACRGAKRGAKGVSLPGMAEAAQARRRGHGEDSIYFDATKNRYVGAVSVGWGLDGKRLRRKVRGKTKQEVRDKLRELHRELSTGVRSAGRYSLRQAVEDWLRDGLDGRSQRTRRLYEGLLEPVLNLIGSKQLREVSAGDVRAALGQLATRYSTRSLQITRTALERAIRHAEANDLVGRNVAALVKPPHGRAGRPSKSFTLEQAKKLFTAAEGTRWHAYVALSLLSGIRTEEARALRWDHVVRSMGDSDGWQPVTSAGFDSAHGEDQYAIYVWRAQRHGGDTKTGKSRRTLALPHRCVDALREHRELQAEDRLRAGQLWHDHGLVFASTVGTPLTASNVIRAFQRLTERAGLGKSWAPREMRHTFVSVLSANGVPVESIALLAGHDRTSTTELVYRHELRPALIQGAEVMDKIFSLPATD
jgi:integrase